jgi:hypothetical protein
MSISHFDPEETRHQVFPSLMLVERLYSLEELVELRGNTALRAGIFSGNRAQSASAAVN